MNDPKPSGIVHVCPETFSLLRYISKNVLHIPERRIQIELYRSPDEVANRVSYNDVKEIKNLHAFASLARIRNYCNARKVQIDYQNIDTVSVRKNPFIALLGRSGTYYPKNNQILFSMALSTTHELLHALSTHYESEQDVYRTGFSIHPFFKALNEGYTELFASRIEERPPHSYLNHVKFVRLVEALFDSKEAMMQAYFDNNLELLVQNMSEYMPTKNAIQLLLKEDAALRKQMIGTNTNMDYIPQRLALYQAVVTNCQDFDKLERFLEVASEDKELQTALRVTGAVSSIKETISRSR